MHLSIVIPTYNRARLLAKTIPALASQETGAKATYEVIFVSNGSTDDTDEVLADAVANFPGKFRYYRIAPTGGPSAPRNVGIRAAEGENIIILDDDVLPEPGLVLAYADFHTQYPAEHHAAIGEVYVPQDLLHDPMSRFHTFPYSEVRELDRLSYLHFWTCSVSMKRRFMLEKGMFDETFLYYEDILCGHRLAAAGMDLHFWPDARGQHLHQMTSAGLPAKALFLGRWLQPLLERVPDPSLKDRLGVLSPELPKRIILKRAASRLAYSLVDNPLTMAALRMGGAAEPRRSRLSDFYYGLIFRRNLLAGHREARRQARAGRPLNLNQVGSVLADRGDS